jgi:hypothetical protein
VFVLRQAGDAVTGEIQGRPGEPAWKIVDGVVRGNQIHFFVLHEDENDPEVKANFRRSGKHQYPRVPNGAEENQGQVG